MIAVVAVGYSRPDSMKSLLDSILKADFLGDTVDLVISIDKGPKQDEVVEVAEKIKWHYGKKIIRKFSERQGLRPHILQCGDLTCDYDAVIVLEDDLNVSPGFYSYVKQALAFFEDDERIGGIALYSDEINQTAQRSFIPAPNGYDAFMINLATSWGECWNKRMWNDFREWYNLNQETSIDTVCVPENIQKWNSKSWLKYFCRFVIETGKYWLYPYWSLTTNSGEAGEHFANKDNDYQIPMLNGVIDYRFPSFENAVKYDAFHERVGMNFEKLNLNGKVVLDLYGSRTAFKKDVDFIISTQSLPYKIINEYALDRRPIEENCLYPSEGRGIYVYDAKIAAKAPKVDSYYIARYDIRRLGWRYSFRYFIVVLKMCILKKFIKK